MKIWLLTSETPWFQPGGIGRYVDNFARQLASAGHDVRVFGRGETADLSMDLPYAFESIVPRWGAKGGEGAPDQRADWPYSTLDYWGAFSFQLSQLVDERLQTESAPDIIESQEYCALPYYLLLRRLTHPADHPLRSIPIVLNAHSPDFLIRRYNEEPTYRMPNYWTGRLEKVCLLAADSVVCPSGYLSRQLEGIMDQRIRVEHIPLPWTDPAQYQNVRAFAEGQGDVLYFGRLEVRKGVIDFLEVCRRLWSEGLDFRLRMVGSDTHYAPRGRTVREWIETKYSPFLEAGNLILENALPHGDLMSRVKAARFVVIPSKWENWPNTCIESLSMGIPVLGSVHGGQAEMIGEDGSRGRLFSWNVPGDFERAFREMLRMDSDQLTRMGQQGRRSIVQFCEGSRVLRRRLSHFEEVIQSFCPRRVFPFNNAHIDGSAQLPETGQVSGRVSVVIPYYNLADYLAETVASVDAAPWEDKEIVIVDDGSTDAASRRVLDELCNRGRSDLKILRKENGGLASARNAGVAAASGEVILLLDADDCIEPSFIERGMEVLRRFDNVHIVYSWERYFGASDEIYPTWPFEFPYLLAHNMGCPICLLYRAAYLHVGGSKEAMKYNFEDFELWINLFKNGFGGVAIPEVLRKYRVRENSMWQGSGRPQHLHLMEQIADLHPELYQQYGKDLYGLLNANGSSQKWLKPCGESAFDQYEEWSRSQITWLASESEKWWRKNIEAEERLQEASKEAHQLWNLKNELERRLQSVDDDQMDTGGKL